MIKDHQQVSMNFFFVIFFVKNVEQMKNLKDAKDVIQHVELLILLVQEFVYQDVDAKKDLLDQIENVF